MGGGEESQGQFIDNYIAPYIAATSFLPLLILKTAFPHGQGNTLDKEKEWNLER